jgi:hypothetical protein
MKYFTTLFVFGAIWLIAAAINTVFSASFIALLNGDEFFGGAFTVALFGSFIFSFPLVGAVWFVTTVAQTIGLNGFSLFKTVVLASLIFATIGVIILIVSFGNELKNATYPIAISILVSAITAVTIFRSHFKTVA